MLLIKHCQQSIYRKQKCKIILRSFVGYNVVSTLEEVFMEYKRYRGREKFCPQKKFAAIILYKVFRSGKYLTANKKVSKISMKMYLSGTFSDTI